MGLFSSYQRDKSAPEQDAESAPVVSSGATAVQSAAGPAKKGVPTPTRKQAEQARMERLHPVLTKQEIRRRNNQARNAAADKRWTAVENQPQRVLLRNYIDSRRTIAEYSWPALLVLLVLSFVSSNSPLLAMIDFAAIILVIVADAVTLMVVWRGFKRELNQRYPGTSTKGLMAYLFNRMTMPRRFRQPKPAINRGDEY